MKPKSFLLLALAHLWLPTCLVACSQELADNAALKYWSAMVSMPQDARMTHWELADESALTASLKDIVHLFEESGECHRVQASLVDMRLGAHLEKCEWGVRDRDPLLPAHHVQRSRTAIGLLLLSARRAYAHNNQQGAMEDLVAAWRFSRHIGQDGTPAGWFANNGLVDLRLLPLTAAWLPELEISSVKKLQAGIDALPNKPTSIEMVDLTARMSLNWIREIREGVQNNGMEWGRDRIEQSLGSFDALAATLENEQELLKQLETAEGLLRQWPRVARLPDAQREAAERQLESQIFQNPFTLVHSQLLTYQDQEFEQQVKMKMLSAAFKLRLEGRDGFEQVVDPAGEEPFVYSGNENSFSLSSKLLINGEPLSIRFGQGAMPSESRKSRFAIYGEVVDGPSRLEKGLEAAKQGENLVLIQWGFDGCIPCYQLSRTIESSKPLAELIEKHYVYLHINSAADELSNKYDVEFSGLPHWTILDASGSVIANVSVGEKLYTNGVLDEQLILEFLQGQISGKN